KTCWRLRWAGSMHSGWGEWRVAWKTRQADKTPEHHSGVLFSRLSGQGRCAHHVQIDGPRGLPALADGPDDQRLAAPHVAGGINSIDRGLVAEGICEEIAALVEPGAELVEHAVMDGVGKADGHQHQIGWQQKIAALDGLAIPPHAGAFDAHDMAALVGNDLDGARLELAIGALGLGRGRAHLDRPIWPGGQFVLLDRGLGTDVELGDGDGALTEGGAHAVR